MEEHSEAKAPATGAIEAIRAASGHGSLLAVSMVLVVALSGPSLSSFQTSVVAPLASSIAQNYGGGHRGAMIAQLAVTLPAAGVVLGGPLTGWLIGRTGYRLVVVTSAILLALAGSAGAYVDHMGLFLATRFVVGMAAVALYSSLVSLCGFLFRGVTLGRMISYQNGMSALMGMSLTLVSGWVASGFGWRTSFLVYLVAAAFALLAAIAWLPPRAAPIAGQAKPAPASLRPIARYYWISIAVFAVVFMVMVQGSLLMAANGIDDPSLQSMVIAASSVTYAGTATATSWIETRLTRSWTFAVALALQAAGVLVMGSIPQLWGAAAGSLLLGAGSGIASTYLVKTIVERAPEAARERAVGLIMPTHYIGQFANPLIMQTLRVAIGIHAAFILVGLVLCAAVVWAAATRSRSAEPQPAYR